MDFNAPAFILAASLALYPACAWAQNTAAGSASDYLKCADAECDKEDFDGAIANYTRALKINPKDAKAWDGRGIARYEKHDFNGAIADFTQALKLNPDLSEARFGLADAEYAKGDTIEAMAEFSVAKQMDPIYAEERHVRALEANPREAENYYIDSGFAELAKENSYDAAIADFSRAAKLNPTDPCVYSFRSEAESEKGDFDAAIADATRAMQIAPKFPEAYRDRAIAEKGKGDLDTAMGDCTLGLKIAPYSTILYNARADLEWANGNADAAIDDCNRTLKIEPNNTMAHIYRGAIELYEEEDYRSSIADFSRAVELDPNLGYAFYNRAFAERRTGKFKAALADDSRAMELNPTDSDACFDRALIRYSTADWAGAIEDFRQYCQLSGSGQEYPQLFIWLLRTRVGEGDAASKDLAAFLRQRGPATGSDWVSKVGGLLLGDVSETELLAAAASPDANIESRHYCEAWFYTGMKLLFAGDKPAAARHFRKCLATGVKTFVEYQFAQAEMKALGQ
jgi:tetratricopeptide (TPR) repeat protein